MKLPAIVFPIQVNTAYEWSGGVKEPDVQVFTLRRWTWYTRSDTPPGSPLLNKPQDAVRSNSHAALCSRPHTPLSVGRQEKLRGAGSWSGRGGPAGQR